MGARFFKTPKDFGKWLAANHHKASELLVGFYKKGTKPSITWPESVREALCYGWIDGVRKSIDEVSYSIRFTPRRSSSIWSSINIRIANELVAEGRMRPPGMKAFEARKENRSGIYAYENRPETLPPEFEKKFRKNPGSWKAFQAIPPSFRRTAIWWIVSAKKEETKLSRLDRLIADPSIALPPAETKKKPKKG